MPHYTPDEPSLSLFDGQACANCGVWKSFSQYDPWLSRSGNATHRYRSTCRDCPYGARRTATAQWHRENRERTKQRADERRDRLASLPIPQSKRCRQCGEEKPASEFWMRANSLDRLGDSCKQCASDHTRQWKAQRKEQLAAYWRDWYQAHQEDVLAKAKARYDTDLRREAARRWREKYPENARALGRRRRNREMQASGSHTGQQWEALKAQYDHRCLCCGQQEPDIRLTRDHVVPLIAGGSDDIDNLQPLCLSCNSRKQKRDFDYRPSFDAARGTSLP